MLGAAEDADVDILLDEPTVSGRHIRLEVVPCGKGRPHREFRCSTMPKGFSFGTVLWAAWACLHSFKKAVLQYQTLASLGAQEAFRW